MSIAFKQFLTVIAISILMDSYAQELYEIDINVPVLNIRSEHLKMGGENVCGKSIGVNNYYITIDDQPVIPITGEFHFSRYPNKYWDESIKKMKAGGINLMATYVFWNIHEEREGQFNWDGDNNLRKFIELCAKNEIDAIVRIGPFCHGEIRNGGLPDWLLGKPFNIRSNDPGYLFYVEKLYTQIGKQLEGLLFKDGGPVIGIQLENEYQHSASPWGLTYPGQPHDYTSAEWDLGVTQAGVGVSRKDNPYAALGNEHLRILKALAIKAGLEVPIYTATGWGNAAVIENETIPVSAAYPFPTWSSKVLSDFYLYTNLQSDPDYAPVRYKSENYPYFAAELGGGIMNNYNRRHYVPAESLDAMINRFLGSGTNGLGYYMYHGGSTPRGKDFFFSDEAYAYPKISYDFQAPIGEFGALRNSYHRLKLIHFFLKDFGEILAPMQISLPEDYAEMKPEEVEQLRYAVRSKNGSGFIFMNNFQDHKETDDISAIQIKIKNGSDEILIPEASTFTLSSGENAILPFNMDLGRIHLNYATAQLLTKGEEDQYFVFFSPVGIRPEFSFRKQKGVKISTNNGCKSSENQSRILVNCEDTPVSEFKIKNADGAEVSFLVLSKEFVLKSWVATVEGKKLVLFSDATFLQGEHLFEVLSPGNNSFGIQIYPKISLKPKLSDGKIEVMTNNGDNVFNSYQVNLTEKKVELQVKKVTDKKFVMTLPSFLPSGINDVILSLDYCGDTGMCFLNGKLVADHFYYGVPWNIGLKKFIDNQTSENEMVFYFRPLYKDAPFYEDFDRALIPDFSHDRTIFEINKIDVVMEYKTVLSFN